MEAKEAIEEFKMLLSVPSEMILKYDCNAKQVEALKRILDSEKMAIHALERHVPKKPILTKERTLFCRKYYKCPCCNEYVEELEHNVGRMNNRYCWNCGQALDWEGR